jgi:hypothetical protein
MQHEYPDYHVNEYSEGGILGTIAPEKFTFSLRRSVPQDIKNNH